jgi:hypothetical protein
MHFIYPADPFTPRQPDEQFREEALALQSADHSISVIDTDLLREGPAAIRPVIEEGVRVTYRGWMLKPNEYQALLLSISRSGAIPLTSLEQYLGSHYLPHWYPLLTGLTPETVVLDADQDPEQALIELNWPRFFVKDYVKSLKTSVGSMVDRPEEIGRLVAEMKKYRGEIEGGLCIRRYEPFIPESERRYFVLCGVEYGPEPDQPIPAIVRICSERIDSRFFSVDVVEREEGELRIVEIGDGQVSDLVGWPVERFVQIWNQHL